MLGRPLYYALAVIAILGLVLAASTTSGTARKTFQVKGFTCASCASSLEAALKAKKGVIAAAADFAGSKVDVTFDSTVITEAEIQKTMEQAGFSVSSPGGAGCQRLPRRSCC